MLGRTRLGYRLALSTVLLGLFVDSGSVVVWIDVVLVMLILELSLCDGCGIRTCV